MIEKSPHDNLDDPGRAGIDMIQWARRLRMSIGRPRWRRRRRPQVSARAGVASRRGSRLGPNRRPVGGDLYLDQGVRHFCIGTDLTSFDWPNGGARPAELLGSDDPASASYRGGIDVHNPRGNARGLGPHRSLDKPGPTTRLRPGSSNPSRGGAGSYTPQPA
jgi:hypothetical protein